MSVVDAVTAELAKLGDTGALGASALVLAALMDDPDNSATSKSMCAGRLLDTMDRLRELAPPERKADKLDELGSRRAARKRKPAA
jgi:hypothetical protein